VPLTEEQAWQVVDYNEKMVYKIVSSWCHHHGYDTADWESIGFIGAFQAVMTYDPTKARLSTWMYPIVKNHLNKAWVKENRGDYQTLPGDTGVSYRKYVQRTFVTHPTPDNIEKDADFFEYSLTEEFEDDLAHRIDTQDAYARIKPYLFRLTEEQQDLIYNHVWKEETFSVIARRLGMSREGVRLRYEKALSDVRKMMAEDA